MTPFDRLHPALQHHVVNTLGWASLRPLQAEAIEPILAGDHAAAARADRRRQDRGGRSSRCSAGSPRSDWRGRSRALRLPAAGAAQQPAARGSSATPRLVGRRVGLWHGDIGAGSASADPRRAARHAADHARVARGDAGLATGRTQRWLFADLRAVVVDEVHAFAGDDRGWHLLAVLERLSAARRARRCSASACRPRSATPTSCWPGSPGSQPRAGARSSTRRRRPSAEPEVTLDHVGTSTTPRRVIAGCTAARSGWCSATAGAAVEELARAAAQRGTSRPSSRTARWAATSAGGPSRRSPRRATASSSRPPRWSSASTSATSTASSRSTPAAPSPSFLQRLGRTGRRPGTSRNALFLATDRTLAARGRRPAPALGSGLRRAGRAAAAAAPPPGPAAPGTGPPGGRRRARRGDLARLAGRPPGLRRRGDAAGDRAHRASAGQRLARTRTAACSAWGRSPSSARTRATSSN